jgi:hypothetical protein
VGPENLHLQYNINAISQDGTFLETHCKPYYTAFLCLLQVWLLSVKYLKSLKAKMTQSLTSQDWLTLPERTIAINRAVRCEPAK